jgi:hypothetical protein
MKRGILLVVFGTIGLMSSALVVGNRSAVAYPTLSGPCMHMGGGPCWCHCQDCSATPKIYSFCTGYQWGAIQCMNLMGSCNDAGEQCMTNLSTTFTYCIGDSLCAIGCTVSGDVRCVNGTSNCGTLRTGPGGPQP